MVLGFKVKFIFMFCFDSWKWTLKFLWKAASLQAKTKQKKKTFKTEKKIKLIPSVYSDNLFPQT